MIMIEANGASIPALGLPWIEERLIGPEGLAPDWDI